MNQLDRAERSLGYVQLTGLGTAQPLAVPIGCNTVLLTVEAQPVRYRDDGVNPTATVGMPLAVGASLRYTAGQMSALRFIEQTAGGIVNMTFYG